MNTTVRYHDDELFPLISQSNTAAFHQLFQTHFQTIYATALAYTKVPQQAEDIVQAVFLKVWEKRAQLNAIVNTKDWLFIAARNEIMNAFRKQTVHRNYVQHIKELFQEEQKSPEDLLILRQKDELLQEGVNRLSARQKEVYLLSREKGLSYEEIAVETGISKNTVREHISMSLKILRQFIAAHKDELMLLASTFILLSIPYLF